MTLSECKERTWNFFFENLGELEDELQNLKEADCIPYLFSTTEDLFEKAETLMRLAVRLQTLMGMNWLEENRKENQ